MTHALPTGTVTLVLGDVEASTERWESSATEMAATTRALNVLVDTLVAEHGGARPVEQGEGDNFVAAFTRASDAVAFAVALQEQSPLPVRVGIHTGEIDVTGGGYAGPTIIRAARLRDAGHGGQVLLSQSTAALVADHIELDDLGEHQLKGLTRPEHVWQLPGEFPPLRLAEDATPRRALTSFVGRELEMTQVRDLVKEPGCVTITGAGGAGKTRLALELTRTAPGWFVDLASVDRSDGVDAAVAETVGARVGTSRPPAEAAAAAIGDKTALLVLDNCEHLLPPCSAIAVALLARCPNLTVLATSREPLGLDGEVTYRLPSLAETEAAELFVERARRANPRFVLDATSAPTVREICARLDGMPLAIELAAARMRVFTAAQLLDALHDRFRLLTGGARTAMPRQRTLEASVEWSYALLLDAERMLLRRLSVFAGGFTTDAAVAVASDATLETHHVFDLLVALVEKSLLTPDERTPGRFHMLETIRHFAAGRLVDEREVDDVRRRHYEFFTQLVHRPVDAQHGFAQMDWVDSVTPEIPNIRRALQWATDQPGYELLLHLAGPMVRFWSTSNFAADGEEALTVLVDRTADAPAVVRSRVLCQRSRFLSSFAMADAGLMATEGIALARAAGDDANLLACILDGSLSIANAYGVDEALLDEAIDLASRLGNEAALAIAYMFRGFHLMRETSELLRGVEFLERSIEVARRNGEIRTEAIAEGWLAMALMFYGDPTTLERAGRAATLLRRTGEGNVLANLLAISAPARALYGDAAGAARDLAELDALAAAIGDAMAAINQTTGHGLIAFARADWEEVVARFSVFLGLSSTVAFTSPAVTFVAVAEAFLGRADEAEEHMKLVRDDVMVVGGVITSGIALARTQIALARGEIERAWDTAFAYAAADKHADGLSATVPALLARLTAQLGRHEEAVRLAGASVGELRDVGLWRALLDDLEPRCRAALGDERFDALWAEGETMGGDAALGMLKRGRGSRQRPLLGWDSLTPTEADVARLVAQGASNKEVAAQLFMSEATVKTHLTRVYDKVGVRNRAQLAASARRPS